MIPIQVYETYAPDWPSNFKHELLDRPPDAILFSSGSTATALKDRLTPDELAKVTDNAVVFSIGPSTSKIIESCGLQVTVEAGLHSVEGMIDALLDYYLGSE